MTKLTFFSFLSIFFILQNQLCYAECHIDDWTALKALYESSDGDNWTNNTNWNQIIDATIADDCNLLNVYGLQVNSIGRVTNIELFNNQLVGSLTTEIGKLAYLNELNLFDNQLAGGIPGTIGNLSLLNRLDLRDNNFSAEMPVALGDLATLTYLDLSNNQFSGLIPKQIGNLILLKDLKLNNNFLIGSIPSEFGNLINIENLDLTDNQLSGEIPAELGDLDKLKYLYLRNNKLSGEIPVALTNLSSLIALFAYDNQLSGKIPSELNQLTKLQYLGFGVNQLSGEIPASLGDLNQLVHLSLDQNNLSGNIPEQLGNLNRLQQLWLHGNNLGGSIPDELGQLTELVSLNLGINQLVGTIPEEMGNLININDLVLNENDLSGCYPSNLNSLCDRFSTSDISRGNNFNATWEDFCTIGIASCDTIDMFVIAPTNYSGDVSISLNNNQNILKNNIATVYDYGTCSDYTNISNCNPVIGFNNLAANEALWAVTKAAEYFSTYHNIQVPNINIIVNDTESPNGAKYKPSQHLMVLGAGDGINRNAISAPDIIGHEYSHAIIHKIKNLGNYKISGAFNESYADIFGELIEQFCYGQNTDWIYGSQVMINTIENNNGLRNLSYPKDETMKYQLPNTYKGEHWLHIDNVCFHIDNCGIHTNSGVHSYWFYLLANGGNGINDNGHSFTVNGIGVEKATAIALENLKNYLTPQSTYNDAREGSIYAAGTLYSNESMVLQAVIDAWNAVGVQEVIENPISFQITNYLQLEAAIVEPNRTIIPVQFDINIDSLGNDISGDALCFTLHLPDAYQDLNLKTVYEPLTAEELSITETLGSINICINRINEVAAKRKQIYSAIVSNSPIIQFGVCIVTEDLDGENITIEPINVSGYTQVGVDELISFQPAPLPFGFDYDENGNMEPQNLLETGLKLHHKNCYTLGAIEIEILDNYTTGIPPYTYTLKNMHGINPAKIVISDNAIHQFYNLEEGEYEIEVKDSNSNMVAITSKKISVDFVAELDGSICCTENLTIPPGIVSGTFNSNGIISFSEGSLVNKGTFEICN